MIKGFFASLCMFALLLAVPASADYLLWISGQVGVFRTEINEDGTAGPTTPLEYTAGAGIMAFDHDKNVLYWITNPNEQTQQTLNYVDAAGNVHKKFYVFDSLIANNVLTFQSSTRSLYFLEPERTTIRALNVDTLQITSIGNFYYHGGISEAVVLNGSSTTAYFGLDAYASEGACPLGGIFSFNLKNASWKNAIAVDCGLYTPELIAPLHHHNQIIEIDRSAQVLKIFDISANKHMYAAPDGHYDLSLNFAAVSSDDSVAYMQSFESHLYKMDLAEGRKSGQYVFSQWARLPPWVSGGAAMGIQIVASPPPSKTVHAPTLGQIAPLSGPRSGGTEVTVKGEGFANINVTCAFGSEIVPGQFVSSTTVHCKSPPHQYVGYVVVMAGNTPGGPWSNPLEFTYGD